MPLRIKNWDKFQHYKDRNPPWIKLHYEILSSKDWVMLDDASKLLALAIMLIASRSGGEVPSDMEYIKKVAHLKQKPNIKPLIDSGFVVGSDDMLASASKCLRSVSVSVSEYDSVSVLGKRGVGRKPFSKPVPKEVSDYAKTIGFELDGQKFCDYYESKGWVIGKSPMKDWKACVRTWKLNRYGGSHGGNVERKRSYGENSARVDGKVERYAPDLVIDIGADEPVSGSSD